MKRKKKRNKTDGERENKGGQEGQKGGGGMKEGSGEEETETEKRAGQVCSKSLTVVCVVDLRSRSL